MLILLQLRSIFVELYGRWHPPPFGLVTVTSFAQKQPLKGEIDQLQTAVDSVLGENLTIVESLQSISTGVRNYDQLESYQIDKISSEIEKANCMIEAINAIITIQKMVKNPNGKRQVSEFFLKFSPFYLKRLRVSNALILLHNHKIKNETAKYHAVKASENIEIVTTELSALAR